MYARVYTNVFIIIYKVFLSKCVTSKPYKVYEHLDNLGESKLELTPLFVPGSLNDIIVISAPILHNSTQYYLSNTEGDTTRLYITSNTSEIYRKTIEKGELEEITKYTNGEIKSIITPTNKMFKVNSRSCLDPHTYRNDKTGDLNSNDFIIGPITEFDHGNWVLSAYVRKPDGVWVELFQVITIQIIEYITTTPTKPQLRPGDTFDLSFAYPIKDLESCEIVAPRSTFDRSYDRSRTNLASCGFRISNLTKADEGLWRIIGVGRIVYESTVFLEVNDVF